MALKNIYTKIPAAETVIDIQRMLSKRGATSITIDYEKGGTGRPVGIRFRYPTELGDVPFAVPINVDDVWRFIRDEGAQQNIRSYYRNKGQAEMTAWRSAFDWLKLQLDYIDIGMIKFDQAMAGFMVEKGSGRTFYELIQEQRLALPEGRAQE